MARRERRPPPLLLRVPEHDDGAGTPTGHAKGHAGLLAVRFATLMDPKNKGQLGPYSAKEGYYPGCRDETTGEPCAKTAATGAAPTNAGCCVIL